MKLKVNSAVELTRISNNEIMPLLRKQKGFRDETTFIAPERLEAITNSLWDTRADAEAYDRNYRDRDLVVRVLGYFAAEGWRMGAVALVICLVSLVDIGLPVLISRSLDQLIRIVSVCDVS